MMAAPTGLVTKPIPKVAKAPSSLTICDSPGKKASPIMSAKKVKTRKSENSIQLPVTTGAMARKGGVVFAVASCGSVCIDGCPRIVPLPLEEGAAKRRVRETDPHPTLRATFSQREKDSRNPPGAFGTAPIYHRPVPHRAPYNPT